MPQPRKSSSKPPASRRSSASTRAKAGSAKPASARGRSAAAKTAGTKQATARGRSAPTRSRPARSASTADPLAAAVGTLRDILSRGVVLTGERLQDTMDEAVKRGRLTRSDGEDLVQRLLSTGRKQTEELLAELDRTLRGQGTVTSAARDASKRIERMARRSGGEPADLVLRQVDRVRRSVGVGPTFPVLGYDDLTTAQITARLDELSSSELRKVRDYERRNANRKTVLAAIERKLG